MKLINRLPQQQNQSFSKLISMTCKAIVEILKDFAIETLNVIVMVVFGLVVAFLSFWFFSWILSLLIDY